MNLTKGSRRPIVGFKEAAILGNFTAVLAFDGARTKLKLGVKRMPGWLRVLLTPSCWIQGEPYVKDVDKVLREAMEKHTFVAIDHYYARLGNLVLWIANYPYDCMLLDTAGIKGRAKRTTILRAYDKYILDTLACR